MKPELFGTVALVAATIIVGASILVGGDAGRLLNGVSGLIWFAAAGTLGLAAFRVKPAWHVWAFAVAMTGVVAFVVKPSDLVLAIVGFGLAGAAMAVVAGPHGLLWAKIVVALYLPFHIGAAVAKAVYRSLSGNEAAIRSDPPPTAAIVPIAMLLAALGGALIVRWARGRGVQRRVLLRSDMRRS
jgi:hypothetical protein